MKFDPNKVTFFARTDARGQNVTFGIKAKDRQRHMYVIGKTGMGKSTLLENMAAQDIQNGEGMAFIDPHGSTAEALLNYIPEHRANDVLYFAPFDTDCPVSFNIMEDVGPEKRHLVVSGLMSVFKKIWVDAWSARMEYILANTLLALLEYPDSTLLGVNRMLSDKAYRELVVSNVKDPGVRAFWVDEFAKYNERYMQEAGDAIKNKIGQFTSNPIIRNIVGQPHSSFDIRKMMDEKKILIMNLSKGLIGESNANLLGSMLTTRIYLAAMSRADLPPEKMKEMPNFYFYVDEFQSFANATFANILSEARKYHLNLTIAHQYIEQMEEEVRNAVFGNVGTIIAFRVGPFDAETLEPIFSPQFLATDIVNLSARQIYLTLMIDGIGSQPFSAVTLPPLTPPVVSGKAEAIARSRAKFTRPRPIVEEEIHKFHEPIVVPKKQKFEDGQNQNVKSANAGNGDAVKKQTVSSERPAIKENSVSRQQASAVPVRIPTNRQASGKKNEYKKEVSQERSQPTIVNEKPKTQSPDDLRAILKTIVSTETQKVSAEKPKEKTVQKEGDNIALKEALRSMLGEQKHVEQAEQVRASTHSEDNNEKVTQYAQRDDASQTQNISPLPRVHEDESPVSGDAKQEVSPKELERMMRVTTSDKPPV